jgi:hypothetical protein
MSRRWVVVDLGSAQEMERDWRQGDAFTIAEGADLGGAGIYINCSGCPLFVAPRPERMIGNSVNARTLQVIVRAIQRGELVRAKGSPEPSGFAPGPPGPA